MNITSLFNLAGPDLIVILFIVLLLFGAKKFPELFRGTGETLRGFLEALGDFFETMSARAKGSDQPGTAFAWAAVIVALAFFLLVVGARWAAR